MKTFCFRSQYIYISFTIYVKEYFSKLLLERNVTFDHKIWSMEYGQTIPDRGIHFCLFVMLMSKLGCIIHTKSLVDTHNSLVAQ